MTIKETVTLETLEHDKEKATSFSIIKRNGDVATYDVSKMRRVAEWACGDSEFLVDELLNDTQFKLFDKIKIADLFDELIKTATNKISMLYPQWEEIAAKLYLMKIYKETWNMKKSKDYVHISTILRKGVQHHVFDKSFVASFTDEELDRLNAAIIPSSDFIFTYKSLVTFFDKYCIRYSKTKKLELPQHTYMRVAMFLHHKDVFNRIENIVTTYLNISAHKYTLATPIMLNSGTTNAQLSSCVLSRMEDDTISIMDTIENIAVYSKFKGGTACDISRLRATGSYIHGNQGTSSGPVPFLKILEATLKGFNQGSSRPGACCVYFQWWHINFDDLVVLKSNGGTDDNRARGLKYGIKINDLLIKRAEANEYVTLFDPHEAQSLFDIVGEEFEESYAALEAKQSIRSKRVRARDIMKKLFKERSETGNVYIFHEENVNVGNMLGRYINSSNLCTEILQPSRASALTSESLMIQEDGRRTITKTYDAGEIALCNLASVNLVEYERLSPIAKEALIYDIMTTMDNTIDLAVYPVKEGANSNRQYRYLGIGVLNLTNYLASKKIVIDTQESLEEQARIFDELSYAILSTSCLVAKERGRFEKFYETQWSKGKLPIDSANKKALALVEYEIDYARWDELRERIARYGVRNALHMAVAPTASSGKAVNATESVEPIQKLFYKEDGTTNIPTLVPNFRKNNKYYKPAHECDQKKLIEGGAIRQMFFDQGQSQNIYIARPDSLKYMMQLHFYGFELGAKTYYYLKQLKSQDDTCESCS